ncbi:putative cell cycle inhibitor Nif1 [Fonsecaea pedrosoi]|nr:putative cell cycle inhibitor Nif1 [Fonsecaea pedrosoi]
MTRPTYIEIPQENLRSASALSRNALSPRIQHFDGDVPPALSPLDAIAARSRKLAKELEETRKAGERRMSRLPPQVVTESLTEHQNNRPPIFRALSDGLDTVPPLPTLDKERGGSFARVAHPLNRPTSQRVHVSALKSGEDQESKEISPMQDYFGAPRVESPPPLEPQGPLSPSHSVPQHGLSRQVSGTSQSDFSATLAPPRSYSSRLRPYQDASDDDYTSSNAGSTFSQSRKLSSSSGVSAPHSPISPYEQSHARSPSSTSLGSPSHKTLTRNFSRPLSSVSMSNLKGDRSPTKATFANRLSQLRAANSFDNSTSPVDGYLAGEASSYTHAKYSLPRGRLVSDRTSVVFSALSTPHFEWQEPMFPCTPPLEAKNSTELPIPSPMASARPSREDQHQRSSPSFELNSEHTLTATDRAAYPTPYYTPTGSLRSNDSSSSRPSIGQLVPSSSGFMHPPVPLSPVAEASHSSRSTSTVRPTTSRSASNYQGLSMDDHVTKAIELHQQGELKESTYHLRIAANKGHPTAMLLYALACRHGWGMRANPREGVQWLRKAVDYAMLEVADDEDPSGQRPGVDFHEKKAHRAQFALSIYELGVSHLNGWGIEQDKALALRCFEIAGNWGDTDALTEAGFCYAEGIGCKKDLKKAAKFYRMAEAKGVSMVGNSWIHKDKYNDSDEENDSRSRSSRKTSSEKPRSKSKSRGIFGRKKTTS